MPPSNAGEAKTRLCNAQAGFFSQKKLDIGLYFQRVDFLSENAAQIDHAQHD